MEVESSLLAEPEADEADSLVSSNDPDDMANEQTWPTDEEMNGAIHGPDLDGGIPEAKKGTTPRAIKRVPKGTSEYQAAWIVDESDEEDVEDAGEDGAEMEEAEEDMVEMPAEDDDDADMETDGRRSVAFQELDIEEEDRQ